MRLRHACFVALISGPASLIAQTPQPVPVNQKETRPPKEVDDVLRARVEEFMKYQMAGSYKKALSLVADDSGDYYLQLNKPKLQSFTLDTVSYSDNFTKALIKGHAKQTFVLGGNTFEGEMGIIQSWKIEDGSWVWYHNPKEEQVVSTPVGDIPISANSSGDQASDAALPNLPKDLTPEAVANAGSAIVAETSISKTKLEFELGKRAEDEILFHNGVPGLIRLRVNSYDNTRAITVSPADTTVEPNGDLKIRIQYDPEKDPQAGANAGPIPPREVRITVDPFRKVYVIPVSLLRPEK